MRNKLFFAFLAVVLTALISNLLYEYLVTRDFEDYVSGTKEDKLYWLLASVEGSYEEGRWNDRSLHDAIHWAIMLGFDVRVIDFEKKEHINSDMVIRMLSPAMKRKMKNIADIGSIAGDFEPYPLYHEGIEIGTMLVRQIDKPFSVNRKEMMFKKRGKTFLLISFAIAGGGAVLLSVFFTLFLSRPLKKMKGAVQAMANRDFSVRLPVTSRDEIGSLSESFNFMAEALEREEALRRHLTSNIAHELRTPLSVMKATVEAMLDGVIEDSARGMKNIHNELEKLIRLVQGIEDITKAEASFFARKDHVTVSLRDFVAAITGKMMPLASAKGLEMKINEAGDVSVHTDADKLERILQNILSNAIKNTPEGGITVDYGTEGEMFFVRVRDTGTGIAKEKLDLIFKRFYHGPESGGLGLGLAIVKELLDVMGGRIDVQSRVGAGSAFTVWLPEKQ
ncbi:MAG: HAMP domain-containing histidine kinase [Nitrospirota bacterium]|nr:HAMP domain-containing histidine kinase [Nitrospirota bacterium]